MISQKTADLIRETLLDWCDDYDMPGLAVQDLLKRLAKVSGNKSFKDSMEILQELFNNVVEENVLTKEDG